ncbi:MAG: hemerythrin family protein [Holophagaceae bacterium]|uniref:Hemerythrin family protein n=1 Tax=Candidatus Geothrix skivensis TaxID=2954439 RepID=A0A9D7XIB4_9BACT|nr:hemerythrin family protein [Candidatus Geothrix skivensis]
MKTLLPPGIVMAIARWNRRYETGIEVIDAQHQSIFEALNRLAEAFRTGRASVLVDESLETLLAYTLAHFQTEETFMQEWGYPGLGPHQAEHAVLIVKVQELRERYAEGSPVVMDVTIFFADLLQHHINQVDMAMVEFLREQQRG